MTDLFDPPTPASLGQWFTPSWAAEQIMEQVYQTIQPKRPSDNPHWKAKVRQVLQHPGRFARTGPARYSLPERMVA